MGRDGTLISSIYSTGIIPGTVKEYKLTQCLNVQDNYVSEGVFICSNTYLNNLTLTEHFRT